MMGAELEQVFVLLSSENEVSLKNFTLESILSGVHCFRCHDHNQLIAVARTLDMFLSQHPKVSWNFSFSLN